MSNPTLATKVTRKLKQVPNRLTADICRYLRSAALASPPTGYQDMINQVTEMLEKMQNLKELSAFCDRFEEAQDEYMPSYPPMSPITDSFFNTTLYFDHAHGPTRESLGSICLELGRAFGMHPDRLRVLETLCNSRMGIFQHRGLAGKLVKLEDLLTQEVHTVSVTSGYRGKAGDVWYARLLPALQAGGPPEVVTTPYVLNNPPGEWQSYFQRHPDPLHLKSPQPWNYWLEFVFEGYTGHEDQAIFLQGLPDLAETRPHSLDFQPSGAGTAYSFVQRWFPAVVQESKKADPVRPRMLALVEEHSGRVCALESVPQKLTHPQVAVWLKKHLQEPVELWLDNSALQAYLSENLLDLKCVYRDSLPQMEHMLEKMSEHMGTQEVSLVHLLGRAQSLQFYQTAHQFYAQRPWQSIDAETVLSFRDRHQHEWGLVVMGSGGQEFGLALFANPTDAVRMTQGQLVFPSFGLGLAPEWMVAAPDLDLIERENLQFPQAMFPWMVHRPNLSHQPITLEQCQEMEWLLENVPRFATTLEPLLGQGRQLQQTQAQPAQDLREWFAILFLKAWRKQTEHALGLAEMLADFSHVWYSSQTRSTEELNLLVNSMIFLGFDYLNRYSRKRSLVLDYLLDAPTPSQPLPNILPLKKYQAIARQLGDYVRALYHL